MITKSSEVTGLASGKIAFPVEMRDEILLLSWLLVLMRTREASQIGFDWAFKGQADCAADKPMIRYLSSDSVVTGLHDSVEQTIAAISCHIAKTAPERAARSGRVRLVLSTSSLSRGSQEPKNEAVLHVEVSSDNGSLDISPVWCTENMLGFTIERHIKALVDIVRMCMSNPNALIKDFLRPTASDLDSIWRWNHLLPPSYNFCMHETISVRAQATPDKVAISSWDGDLTYSQIETYSTHIAHTLAASGVRLHDVLPVCFEKSRWTIVAVLAVMKIGATFVLMDPTLPLARLQNMAEQVGATTILSSRKQSELSASILPGVKPIIVESETFECASEQYHVPALAIVPPSALMYIIFTSGSTGTPKGVKISHETYTSSAIPRAKAVGYTEQSRVLDFASYAFDVSIDSMLLTLGNGGCLCIPSDDDRLNDINGAIRRMQINYAGLTPSLARILDSDVIASLEGLGLGGEAVSARDATIWGQETRIIIGYGPCECTIGCTVNSSAATGRDYLSIGPGNGAAIWITDPDNHEALMPVGAVGELLVEGPIVGQGYLNDPEKTAAAFIEDPSWLVSGHRGYAGRSGRLYKTGDLGRYDPDGSGGIVFAGRKDTQVKLRGQRVELGEIESQLRARLPHDTGVVVEVIAPQNTGSQTTLVAFIAFKSTRDDAISDLRTVELSEELSRILSEVDADLTNVLPRYMVPTAYIPVNHIPVLISLKIDRKQLRQLGSTIDLRQLDRNPKHANRSLSDLEESLRLAWSRTLNVDADTIRLDDNFFALGGDSLAAMRLVSDCRAQGLGLTVIRTFGHPTLAAMAGVTQLCNPQAPPTEIPAFSTISRTVQGACLEASQACGCESTAVEDIYPCTPTQESLFTFSLKSVKVYVAQRVARIPPHIDVDDWKKAWESVVKASPILRTRLAQLQEPGLQQVVLKETIAWKHSTDLKQYLEIDRTEKMDLGQSLARYAIVNDARDGTQYMVWTVHHVLYDGWSEPLVLKQVSDTLQERHLVTQAQMRDFVEYVRATDEHAMQKYWQEELNGAVGPQFPRIPSRDYVPTPDGLLERQVSFETSPGSSFTVATVIRAAWALVASQYTGSDDVVFGETLTGRDISLPGVDSIVGPLIATVPVRIHVHRTSTVESYLQTVQQATLDRIPYQHIGMQNIRKVSRDAQYACEAGTGLVVQPEPDYVGTELGFSQGDVVREALYFNPYPLMLAFGIRKGGFRACASFDSSLIDVAQMNRVFAQLEMACQQLTKNPSRKISEISCLPEADLNQIWGWNQVPPLSFDKSKKRCRAATGIKQGSVYPRSVIPWVCDPRNSSFLSPIGCVGELWLEGNSLLGETMDTPSWLAVGAPTCASGRTGKVQRTGDMVQLQDDGSLIFIRHRDDVLPINGHVVDIEDLEAHASRYLPSTVRNASVVFQPVQAELEPELVMFIEQYEPSTEDFTKLIPTKHVFSCGTSDQKFFTTKICSSIPVSIVVATKKLDKYIQDSLSSYMVPSTYVFVERLPDSTGQIDRSALGQLVSKIPRHVLIKLRDGLKDGWAKTLEQTNLSSSERILRSSWARILAIEPEQIDVDDNFFRLGGDSVLAMKLVSSLRAQGHSLTVADIFTHMRLGDAARFMKAYRPHAEIPQQYKPFSTLSRTDVESFLSKIVRPRLAGSRCSVQDVVTVTDSQVLDIRGTIRAPRTSIQYTMLYLDKTIDEDRLIRACDKLIERHDILRTVFIEHDTMFFQVVLNELDMPVIKLQADKDLEQCVNAICTADVESEFALGSSFLKIIHVQGLEGQNCLIIRLSHAQYDGVSLPKLLRDLETLYVGGEITNLKPYPLYISQIRNASTQSRAIEYWRDLLAGSSLSVLDGMPSDAMDRAVFRTKTVDVAQRSKEITTATLLNAAWALVLARRLHLSDVTFGSITSGRSLESANTDDIMGPCYQFTPVRVPFELQWTRMDLLHFVQKQGAESAAYDFLGFEKISKLCTQWSANVPFFDSIVHHQDVEDFDTMPFAGGSCGVEILNPHGDAASPYKAVSFLRSGQMQVGFVGSERDSLFIDVILEELAAAVEELATPHSSQILTNN